MKSGIYKIINIVNSKFYISSAVDMEHRWATHKWNLDRKSHGNRYLQAAWNKYGSDSFQLIKLEYCERKFLLIKEQAWVDWTKCYNRNIGYNLRKIVNSNEGVKWTEERRKLQSAIMKDFKHTEEAKARMRGRIKTPEEIYKSTLAKIGKPRSEETKRKIGDANRGRTRNGKDEKWPHENRSKCKCRECQTKKNEYLKNWSKLNNKNYEIINVQTF